MFLGRLNPLKKVESVGDSPNKPGLRIVHKIKRDRVMKQTSIFPFLIFLFMICFAETIHIFSSRYSNPLAYCYQMSEIAEVDVQKNYLIEMGTHIDRSEYENLIKVLLIQHSHTEHFSMAADIAQKEKMEGLYPLIEIGRKYYAQMDSNMTWEICPPLSSPWRQSAKGGMTQW